MPENKMNNISDRFVLEPGDLYFGSDEDVIYTLLGSCVAVTLWHPKLLIAAMCHITSPTSNIEESDTRYANSAINVCMKKITSLNTVPLDYEVGVYGGGSILPVGSDKSGPYIGEKNLIEVEKLLKASGFLVKNRDVGDNFTRKLTLNRLTGDIILERIEVDS